MELSQYNSYNSSFRKKFIYRLGGSTGFFSEYNNMVLAMHYCLINQLQFVLESEGANFSIKDGWNDFYRPFCYEIKNKWLRRFNYRNKPAYKNRYEWACFNLYKRIHPNTILMYSLFDTIRGMKNDRTYSIPEVGLFGSLLDNCREIHKMIWRYNEPTEKRISALIHNLHLPKRYVGIHIRLGDKNEEAKLFDPIEYMELARRFSDEKEVFVLTDDYRAIISLKQSYPDYRFYTLCMENEMGYSLSGLMKKSKSEQMESYFRLWASMDVLEQSILFVGTYSANPGMNMGFRLAENQIKCLDYENWILW